MKKELKALVSNIQNDGTIEAIASVESEDRDGDVIKVSGWDLKNFKKNPRILWSHRSDLLPIGKAVKIWIDGNALKMKVKFASAIDEFAGKVERMFKEGFLDAFSVGFMVKEKDDKGAISGAELLEVSAVNVPANPGALAMRAFKDFKADEKKLDDKEIKVEVDKVDKWIKEDVEKVEKKKEEKSPAYRLPDETVKECVARKVPELINEGMKRDQAVAVANKLCSKTKEDNKDNKVKVEEDVKNQIRNAIDSCEQAAQVLKTTLQNTESVKGDKADSKIKVVISADKSQKRRKARIAYRVLESLLKDLKN